MWDPCLQVDRIKLLISFFSRKLKSTGQLKAAQFPALKD